MNAAGKRAVTFENDIKLRRALKSEKNIPVVTLTYSMIEVWKNRVQQGKLSRFVSVGGTNGHILIKAIRSLFVSGVNVAMREQDYAELLAVFLHYSILGLLDEKEMFWTKEDTQFAEKMLNVLDSCPQEKLLPFGSMKYEPKGRRFVLDASEGARCDSEGQITKEFEKAWSLFWILEHCGFKVSI